MDARVSLCLVKDRHNFCHSRMIVLAIGRRQVKVMLETFILYSATLRCASLGEAVKAYESNPRRLTLLHSASRFFIKRTSRR